MPQASCSICGQSYKTHNRHEEKDPDRQCPTCIRDQDPISEFDDLGFDDVKIDPGQTGARFIERMRVKE